MVSNIDQKNITKSIDVQGAAYVFERLSEATVRPELYFFDFQRFLA